MSPAEAGAITEEPDWAQMFKGRGGSETAFENLLLEWRKWHWTPIVEAGVEKKKMAPSVDGVIALALLGVMPPRTLPDRPPGPFEEQIDDHCWFLSQGRAWRILGIEDGMLMLNSFGDEWQIDLSRAKWDKYIEASAAALRAWRK
jgi:hypothetical protein